MNLRLRLKWLEHNLLQVEPTSYRVIVENDKYWREVMVPWMKERRAEIAAKYSRRQS